MHKIPSGARFIIACKKCINKQISKHVPSASNYVTAKRRISKKNIILVGPNLLGNRKWLPFFRMYKLNKRKTAKQISTFDFSTLYAKIPHDKLLDIL